MKTASKSPSVYDILDESSFRIKKHFGQNFLKDQNILKKIVDSASITSRSGILEVGPGLGSLTEFLIETNQPLLAYEIDNDLIPILSKRFEAKSNFHLIHDDILKRDIDTDIAKHLGECTDIVVVANLPYYITTPILMKFLETSKRVNRMILMMQFEVANRVTSKPNTKDYNALSVVINYLAKTKFLFKVPKTVFVPAPNVDSAIVEVIMKNDLKSIKPVDESLFFEVVHYCFKQRRKTLINNLREAYPHYQRVFFESMLETLGLRADVRAEVLSIDDFIRISDFLYHHQT